MNQNNSNNSNNKRRFQNRKNRNQANNNNNNNNNHQKNRRYQHKKPRFYDEPVSQAELDESIEFIEVKEEPIIVAKQYQPLVNQHRQLKKQIAMINNRLKFGYSEALEDYRNDLLKQDFVLLSQITDVL